MLLPLGFALVSLSLCGPAAAQTLTVYLGNAVSQPGNLIDAMKREAEAIVEPAGLTLEWQALETRPADMSSERLAVVRLKGDCGIQARPGQLSDRDPLASTHAHGDRVLPFTELRCDTLTAMLGGAVPGEPRLIREKMVGRAMGRVLAHELYHILGQVKRHASAGAAKSCFQVRDLVADSFRFDAYTLAMLQRDAPSSDVGAEDAAAGR